MQYQNRIHCQWQDKNKDININYEYGNEYIDNGRVLLLILISYADANTNN